MATMKQAKLGFDPIAKKTRRSVFLDEMEKVVPWGELVALVEPHAPKADKAKGGRPPFAVNAMLRVHFMQQWFGLGDLAMEEALHDTPMLREFAGLSGLARMPDESTILRFRHVLETHKLAQQMLATINAGLSKKGLLLKAGSSVDATLIAAPSSTKNSTGERDPEMHQTKKGNQWHFGMKAHIGVDAESGLVHSVVGTAANVSDITQAHALVRSEDKDVFADAGYQGIDKREEVKSILAKWHVAMRPGKRRALNPALKSERIMEQIEQLKATVRAKVEHPFRVIKRQFGFVKVRYRGLVKNTAQLVTLFALSNLWMVRKRILQGLRA
jgi:transposase, IS5 family